MTRLDDEFTQRVIDVLKKIQAVESSPEEDRDVRGVAVGLRCITNAVNHYSRVVSSALVSGETGANEALAILAAITTGQNHPIWKYLEGIRKPKVAAKVDPIQNQRRYIIIGCVQAYKAAANCSMAKAYRDIARECSLPDVAFSESLIEGWHKRYKKDKDVENREKHLKAIAAYEQRANFVAAATDPGKPLTAKRVLDAACKLVGQGWGVPYVKRPDPDNLGSIPPTL